ncbi:MAG: peptidase [Hyphomonadaceae bacterium]
MTYCVGLCLDEGAVLLSDTRTNAGVDNIAVFSKMHVLDVPGQRTMALMTAGNLAVTQAVLARVIEGAGIGIPAGDPPMTLYTAPTMYDAARLVGDAIREVYKSDGEALAAQNFAFEASIILVGQIAGRRLRMFHIYSAGNFIESSVDTPFFQIGENKYGKPILDRVAQFDTPLHDAVKLAFISMDSTIRSNLSVGLPLDLFVYRRDALQIGLQRRIDDTDSYYGMIRSRWSEALRSAYRDLPTPDWMSA